MVKKEPSVGYIIATLPTGKESQHIPIASLEITGSGHLGGTHNHEMALNKHHLTNGKLPFGIESLPDHMALMIDARTILDKVGKITKAVENSNIVF